MRVLDKALLGLLVAAIHVVGCDGSDRPVVDDWSGSVDTLSSRRVRVTNRDLPAWRHPLRLQERFRLGSVDGDGPELFGQIAGLELGAHGELYVLDGQAAEIRVFGSDGVFQRSFGGEGEGPGELRSPSGLALDPDGTLWVLNWGNARYSGFDPATGAVRREVRRRLGFASFPWRGAFEDGARLVDIGLNDEGRPAVLRLDTTFVPRDTLALPEARDEDRIFFHRGPVLVAAMMEPFAPQPSWAPRRWGGIVVGEGAEYRLHRIGFDGDTSMTIELMRDPARTTDAERDSALAFFEEMAETLDGATPDRRPKARATKPVHGHFFVDDRDRTWVLSVPGAGVEPGWDVFAPDGRFLGQVPVPVLPGFLAPALRGDRMAVATQIDGYPTVVVYDLLGVVENR